MKPDNWISTHQGMGILLVLISTVSLSTEAIAAKIAYGEGINVISVLSFRYIIAAVVFGTLLLPGKQSLKLPPKDLLSIAVLALGAQSATVLLLFNSFRYIPAAMAILFLYLYPTIVTFLAHYFFREPLTWRKISALILTLTGCAIILGQPLDNLDFRGVAFSIGAAFTNALFLVGSTRMINHIKIPVYNTYMTGMIAVFFCLMGMMRDELIFPHTPAGWGAILVLGVVCTVVAMGALLQGVKIIGASRAAIISTLEPASTAILGFWLLQETISGLQMMGGTLILAGVFLQRQE